MTVLGPDALLDPLQKALTDSGLGEAELWVHRRHAAITRYSNSSIHENAVSEEPPVPARAIAGSAAGSVSGNSLEPDALRELLERAAALARLQAPNADWPGLAPRAELRAAHAFDGATATLDAAEHARAIGRICEAVEARGLRAAGTHSVDVTQDAVANPNGLAAHPPATLAYLRPLLLGDHGGSGYADDLSQRAAALDPHGIAARAI